MSKTFTRDGNTKFMLTLGSVTLSLLLAATSVATRAADLSSPTAPR